MTPENEIAMHLERFRPMLVTLVETMLPASLRSHLEASDLVQHTLMEAHSNAALLATLGEGPIFSWLRKALKNNLLDAIKHLKTQKHDIRRILRTTELDESFIRLEHLFVAGDTSPSEIAQRNEQISIMLAAIQELPDNQRTAIIMKHLRGHSLKEVAKAIGLSESATAGLLHRGRQQLVRCMEYANHER